MGDRSKDKWLDGVLDDKIDPLAVGSLATTQLYVQGDTAAKRKLVDMV